MSSHSSPRSPKRLPRRVVTTTLILCSLGTSLLALPSRADERAARFVCADGERFSVDYRKDHVRLRTGTGIFVLKAQHGGNGDASYSDGNTALSGTPDHADLTRAGLPAQHDCRREAENS